MLSRSSFPCGWKPAPRRPVAVLFGLMLLGCGLLLPRSSAQPPDKEAPRAPAVAEDGLPSLEEMRRHIPPHIPAEQRKQMLRMMEEYRERMKRQRALAMRQGPFGPAFPPGGFQPFRGGAVYAGLSRLGARFAKPGATLTAQLDLPRGQGLVLEEVTENSAAAKAGLKAHDILLELDGKAVSNSVVEFMRLLEKVKEDAAVDVVVLRRGKNETIKGLKLPRAEAAPAFGPADFRRPPQMPPVPFAMPAAPAFGGLPPGPPFGAPGGNGVLTTTFRDNDRFVTRHQEGSLIITVLGKAGAGKAAVLRIHVQDGRDSGQYDGIDKVPDLYRAKVKGLIETVQKSNARLDVKAP